MRMFGVQTVVRQLCAQAVVFAGFAGFRFCRVFIGFIGFICFWRFLWFCLWMMCAWRFLLAGF